MESSCHICGSRNWKHLPDPLEYRSVTTSGKLVNEPLGKSFCIRCGLVQRIRPGFLGMVRPYYEEDYASYYDRPGTEEFHKKRYRQLVDWMCACLPNEFNFSSVLDVGCGQGWAMDAMKSLFGGIDIIGIEPSKHNSAIAKSRGNRVLCGKIEDLNISDKYDLIYSNNVIQHVNDARFFMQNVTKLLSENGVVIFTCPDGSKPNIELFFCDHNYSFLPDHLIDLGKEFGFRTILWSRSADNPALPPAQLALFTSNRVYSKKFLDRRAQPETGIEKNLVDRTSYINSITDLRSYLTGQIAGYTTVYNFGASFWTSVLAGYCPDYWNGVEACLVDNTDNAGLFLGKKILEFHKSTKNNSSIVVLGTSPATHGILANKLQIDHKIVRWDRFFRY